MKHIFYKNKFWTKWMVCTTKPMVSQLFYWVAKLDLIWRSVSLLYDFVFNSAKLKIIICNFVMSKETTKQKQPQPKFVLQPINLKYLVANFNFLFTSTW